MCIRDSLEVAQCGGPDAGALIVCNDYDCPPAVGKLRVQSVLLQKQTCGGADSRLNRAAAVVPALEHLAGDGPLGDGKISGEILDEIGGVVKGLSLIHI